MNFRRRMILVLPGLLVAATGVGAGDLATGAIVGQKLGVAVLWGVLVGAGLKYVVTEGLARYQLVSGESILSGAVSRLGPVVSVIFLPYLLLWSFFVGAALMSACGVAIHALIPVFDDASTGKIVWGVLASALGVGIVLLGGFDVFARIMAACIGVMFCIVVVTAIAISPDWAAVFRGLVVPAIPDARGEGTSWTLALIGGVGGTLTVLCYGYWIEENDRRGPEWIRACRIDLAVGYATTAIFGLAMVIIGSALDAQGKGAGLIVALGQALDAHLGSVARWAFLIGAFAAVFSSLLGVWQAVPYVFADYVRIARRRESSDPVDVRGRPYRMWLFGIAAIPIAALFLDFTWVQKIYAVIGAWFLPLLALALLLLGRRHLPVEKRFGPFTTASLVVVLAVFGYFGYQSFK